MKTLKHALKHRDPDVSIAKAVWIWIWFNDVTRFLIPLLGLHLVVTLVGLDLSGLRQSLSVEVMKSILIGQYSLFFLWAMADNDYENLNRIGLTVDRTPLIRASKGLTTQEKTPQEKLTGS